jgi:hypothetical protein
MAQQVKLVKRVYDKNQYQRVIDTSFTQLVQPVVVTDVAVLPTVDEFLVIMINYFLIYLNLEKQTLMSILSKLVKNTLVYQM